jgi:putative intracellular protease/amidase
MSNVTQPSGEPAQHLLGGLRVALLVSDSSNPGEVLATRRALEERGVEVTLLSTVRARPIDPPGGAGDASLDVPMTLAAADPEGFDGAAMMADEAGVRMLMDNDDARVFLRRLQDEGKPVARAPAGDALAAFNDQLKAALARRRRKTMSPSDDTPSAMGEDG